MFLGHRSNWHSAVSRGRSASTSRYYPSKVQRSTKR
jgi:hypothetical protein